MFTCLVSQSFWVLAIFASFVLNGIILLRCWSFLVLGRVEYLGCFLFLVLVLSDCLTMCLEGVCGCIRDGIQHLVLTIKVIGIL